VNGHPEANFGGVSKSPTLPFVFSSGAVPTSLWKPLLLTVEEKTARRLCWGQECGENVLPDAANSAVEFTIPSSAHPKRTVGIVPKNE